MEQEELVKEIEKQGFIRFCDESKLLPISCFCREGGFITKPILIRSSLEKYCDDIYIGRYFSMQDKAAEIVLSSWIESFTIDFEKARGITISDFFWKEI